MSVRRRKPPTQEVDLEATAELPVVAFEVPAEDRLSATDTLATMAIPAGVPELTDSLREVETRLQRKIERVRQLEAQLAQVESERKTDADQQQGYLDAARHSSEETAGRLAATEQQLSDVRGELEARASELADARGQLADYKAQLVEQRQLSERVQREARDHARDVDELRQRAARQQEVLQHAQGVRGVFEALIHERDSSLAQVESRHAADIAATAVRVQAQQEEFRQREAALVAGHAEREAALVAERDTLRRETSARIAELEAAGNAATAELAQAAGRLQAAESRSRELAGQVEAQGVQIAGHETELAQLRATHEAAAAGAAMFEAQQARIRELENERAAAVQRATQLDQDLRAAEDQIQRLESDARANALLLGHLQQDIARLGTDDTGARPALKLVAAEHLPDRFLVSSEGGMEVGHPLGRRTTIGRTPDNDIQIDASYISRHHAVILGSSLQCVIEDLNSTNGVLVNGRRINRQLLQDGDNVTIGKAVFRFQQPA